MAYGIGSILGDIDQKADTYRNNPDALAQSYQQNQQLIDLLVLQKLKTDKEAAQRDMQAKMQTPASTIKDQREQQVMGMTRNEVAQQVTPGLQALAQQQQAAQAQGISSLPAPNMQQIGMAEGGIVNFAEGDPVRAPSPASITSYATRMANKYDISPELFLSLVRTESSMDPGAVSPSGAVGLTQLMPGTAEELGVDENNWMSNLEGGAKYFKQQLDRFGSPQLALAAYNAGATPVVRAGGIPDYPETQSYVRKVMAGADVGGPPPDFSNELAAISQREGADYVADQNAQENIDVYRRLRAARDNPENNTGGIGDLVRDFLGNSFKNQPRILPDYTGPNEAYIRAIDNPDLALTPEQKALEDAKKQGLIPEAPRAPTQIMGTGPLPTPPMGPENEDLIYGASLARREPSASISALVPSKAMERTPSTPQSAYAQQLADLRMEQESKLESLIAFLKGAGGQSSFAATVMGGSDAMNAREAGVKAEIMDVLGKLETIDLKERELGIEGRKIGVAERANELTERGLNFENQQYYANLASEEAQNLANNKAEMEQLLQTYQNELGQIALQEGLDFQQMETQKQLEFIAQTVESVGDSLEYQKMLSTIEQENYTPIERKAAIKRGLRELVNLRLQAGGVSDVGTGADPFGGSNAINIADDE